MYVVDALEAAKKSGKNMQYIAGILPQLLNSLHSRPVTRRQTRLQKLKALLVKKALDKHFSGDNQPQRLLGIEKKAVSESSVTTLHMPGEGGKVSHAYMVFNQLLKTSASTSASVSTSGPQVQIRNSFYDQVRKLHDTHRQPQ